MKKIVLSALAGAALMASVPAAQAASLSITVGSSKTQVNHVSNDWHYGDSYRHMRRDNHGDWHDDRDDHRSNGKYGKNDRYGGKYGDSRYNDRNHKGSKVVVVKKRQPFEAFRRSLARQHYSHFSKVVFVKSDRYWPDHYRAYGRDRSGKNIEVRISVFTGDVLGWRYR